jgi:integrase
MTAKAYNNRASGLKGVAQTVAHSGADKVPYLHKRGSIFWFRRRAPKPFSPKNLILLDEKVVLVGKNGYVHFSLETTNRKEASVLARKYAHLLDQEAEKATHSRRTSTNRAELTDKPAEFTATEISEAAELMHAILLEADEHAASEHVDALFADEDTCEDNSSGIRKADRHSWNLNSIPPNTPSGQVELIKMLMPTINLYLQKHTGKVAEKASASLLPFANAFRRYLNDMESKLKGNVVHSPMLSKSETDIKLSELYERFRLHKTVNKSWKVPETSHTRDYFPIVREFLEVVGDKAVSSLCKRDSIKYYEHTIERTDIAIGTKSRNFDRIKAILAFGEKHYDIPNIKGPLEVEASYKKTHQSYKRFSNSELKILFESEKYRTNSFKKPSEFWMPMLGLYTGARIAELAGLELDKISSNADIPCCFLSHPKSANAGGKNSFAPRWVPIHPALIEAGFLQYVELLKSEKHIRLFPCIGSASRDGYGKRATDDFAAYRRELGIGTDKGEGQSEKVFHSFRSTLVSKLIEQRVDGDTRRALVGHVSNEVFRIEDSADVHDMVYDQSEIDFKRLYEGLSKAHFGLNHVVYSDTEKMKKTRHRLPLNVKQ